MIQHRAFKKIITILVCCHALNSQAAELFVGGSHPSALHSISEAIAKAPIGEPSNIYLAPGIYREKLEINKPQLSFYGDGSNTTISYDVYAGRPHPDGGNWGTWRSATVIVNADQISFNGINIENSFDYLANDALEKTDPRKLSGSQAVALMLDKNADRFVFSNGEISGFQDTLFTLAGRSIFYNSIIRGNVDFIFGAGTAVFINNTIEAMPRARAMQTIGFVTAPSTDISTPYGLIFLHNTLVKTEGVQPDTMALGRPWHPTTTFEDGRYADPGAIGQAVFIDNWMDDHIKFTAWHPMSGTSPSGAKLPFAPENARFFEYQNCGPGAHVNSNRRQLNETEAHRFKLERILKDWRPYEAFTINRICTSD